MTEHLIVGAGKFSHAHLRVLNELSVKHVELLKNSPWQHTQIKEFETKHSAMHIDFFSNETHCIDCDFYKDKIVHIVTPSVTHLAILDQARSAERIFVEKPSVLYESSADFVLAKNIADSKSLIYHNDWFAGIQDLRTQKTCPDQIRFNYDVANNDTVDLIAEIASHCVIFLCHWFEPDVEIQIQQLNIAHNFAEISLILDNRTRIDITVSSGRVAASAWQCQITNGINTEHFDSVEIKGSLLINTLSAMLTNSATRTNWYKASWMIHRFRMLDQSAEFYHQFEKFY